MTYCLGIFNSSQQKRRQNYTAYIEKGTWNKDPAQRSGHAYIVKNVSRDANGDVVLTLVNPWGHNNDSTQVEAKDVKDIHSPVVQVKLKDIIANKHLEDIEIGTAPAAPKP